MSKNIANKSNNCTLSNSREKNIISLMKIFVRVLPEITRISRRVYIGNLNPKLDYLKKDWLLFFKSMCKNIGMKTENPIVSVWLHHEKKFCFIEFRAISDANLAIKEFQKYNSPTGREFRVGRPKKYENPPAFLENYILGHLPVKISSDFNVTHIDEQLLNRIFKPDEFVKPWNYPQEVNRYKNNFSKSDFFHDQQTSKRKKVHTLPIPGKGSLKAQRENPNATRVIALFQKLFLKDIGNKESRRALLSEIKQECFKKAKINDIAVSTVGHSKGTVYLKFYSIDASIAVYSNMKGKLFSGRKIKVDFFSEDLFDEGKI